MFKSCCYYLLVFLCISVFPTSLCLAEVEARCATKTPTPTPTRTPTCTPTKTPTKTPTPTPTKTPTPTPTKTPTPTPTPVVLKVSPVLECVYKKSESVYVAYFGYNNKEAAPVSIPVGNTNKFTPLPNNRNQPTTFSVGRNVSVFSVEFDGQNLVWTLTSSTATASKTSQPCPLDCMGVPFGSARVDACGVCGGDNSTCKDCAGVPNGESVIDSCGVCGGDNSTCKDCKGNPNGQAVVDECGVCGGDNSTCKDCAGVPNGDAQVDQCGVCDGKNNTCLDCAGVPNGESRLDECGVCGGDNSTCKDCAGVPNGDAQVDQCGVCDNDPMNDCSQDCSGAYGGAVVVDECGVCGGDNSTCKDCAGVPNGSSLVDACGVCNGGDSCLDCNGVPNGGATVDACDVCGGDGTTCQQPDCDKVFVEYNKLSLIENAKKLANEKTIKYFAKEGACWSARRNYKAAKLTKTYIKRTKVVLADYIKTVNSLTQVVEVCAGECVELQNETKLQRMRLDIKELYRLASKSQHGARKACKTDGKGLKQTKPLVDTINNQINQCSNKACA
jgi:hypothetical protein